jgi:hypothetical protein
LGFGSSLDGRKKCSMTGCLHYRKEGKSLEFQQFLKKNLSLRWLLQKLDFKICLLPPMTWAFLVPEFFSWSMDDPNLKLNAIEKSGMASKIWASLFFQREYAFKKRFQKKKRTSGKIMTQVYKWRRRFKIQPENLEHFETNRQHISKTCNKKGQTVIKHFKKFLPKNLKKSWKIEISQFPTSCIGSISIDKQHDEVMRRHYRYILRVHLFLK